MRTEAARVYYTDGAVPYPHVGVGEPVALEEQLGVGIAAELHREQLVGLPLIQLARSAHTIQTQREQHTVSHTRTHSSLRFPQPNSPNEGHVHSGSAVEGGAVVADEDAEGDAGPGRVAGAAVEAHLSIFPLNQPRISRLLIAFPIAASLKPFLRRFLT